MGEEGDQQAAAERQQPENEEQQKHEDRTCMNENGLLKPIILDDEYVLMKKSYVYIFVVLSEFC